MHFNTGSEPSEDSLIPDSDIQHVAEIDPNIAAELKKVKYATELNEAVLVVDNSTTELSKDTSSF